MNRRGASEVIAALLMIVITVAGAVLLYVYAAGLMGRLQSNVQQPYLSQVALEYYDWTTLSSLTMRIRNVGTVPVTFVDFFVGGYRNTTALTFGTGCSSPGGVVTVQSSCMVTFLMPTGFTPSAGVAYAVKLVAKDGAIFTYNCLAGQSS